MLGSSGSHDAFPVLSEGVGNNLFLFSHLLSASSSAPLGTAQYSDFHPRRHNCTLPTVSCMQRQGPLLNSFLTLTSSRHSGLEHDQLAHLTYEEHVQVLCWCQVRTEWQCNTERITWLSRTKGFASPMLQAIKLLRYLHALSLRRMQAKLQFKCSGFLLILLAPFF